jgi:hypothetical protein
MHVIIIMHKTCSVKVGLNTKLTPIMFKSTSHLIYDTKVFQILYSTDHKLNGRPCFLIFLCTQLFNLLSCDYIKDSVIFKLHLGQIFFCLLDHGYIHSFKFFSPIHITKTLFMIVIFCFFN